MKIKSFFNAASIVILGTGCSLSNLVDVNNPETGRVLDRDFVRSAQGAVGLFNASIALLQQVNIQRTLNIAFFTDELTLIPDGTPGHSAAEPPHNNSDSRRGSIIQSKDGYYIEGLPYPEYQNLNTARLTAIQARSFLKNLKDPIYDLQIAGSYAVEGYSIIMLAEDLCSGIPLSEIPEEGKVIYGSPLTTEQLLLTAVAKFDSSLQIPHDSSKYVALAKIGKGRALMGLGDYRKAAESVVDIQMNDKFEFKYSDVVVSIGTNSVDPQPYRFWTWTPFSPTGTGVGGAVEVLNGEGINGLVWFADPKKIDPRLPVTTQLVNGQPTFTPPVRQLKFVGANVSFTLAKWAEAKMIQAESYLKDNDTRWIEQINEARRSVGLADTVAPSNQNEKIDLLFRERAYWFYGEGVRLSDYRRLVRQYDRNPHNVYPTGPYTRQASVYHYGNAYVYVPLIDEIIYNHKYEGCFNTNP